MFETVLFLALDGGTRIVEVAARFGGVRARVNCGFQLMTPEDAERVGHAYLEAARIARETDPP